MSLQFAASLPSEQTAVIEFLRSTFQADSELLSFRPDVLQWKYFSDHPDWHRDRSYVLKNEGGIVAHGGVWPLRLTKPGADVDAIHLIDWAASRATVGSGLLLLKKVVRHHRCSFNDRRFFGYTVHFDENWLSPGW